jgi:hypothetical protein
MAGPPPRYEPDTTPRQQTPESMGQSDIAGNGDPHVEGRIDGDWGQVPEPGNVVAEFHPGALRHKEFKRAQVQPIQQTWPYRVMRNPRHGGDHRGEGQP